MATYRDDWRLKGFFKGIGAIVLTGGGAIAFENSALAQSNILPDATLGAESSTVTSPIPGGFLIEGGATRETNLFHSFEEFSLPSEGIAYFNNALTIENIISRVTGTSVSNIDGLIAANGTANLFLINPNGIEFGSKAALNLGGSFLASTANSLIFDNGFEFSATNPQSPSLLSVNLPLGLQYGTNPGRIVTQASVLGLQVRTGQTLALVGGEVDIEGGFLFAPDGHIELGSVAGNSRVNLRATDTGYALNYEGVENFQDISLTQKAFVVAGGNNGGSIQVQSRNLTLTDGAQISVALQGAGVGGDLTVNASDSVQVIGTSADGRSISGLFTRSEETATGKVGDLTINTPWLLIRDGGAVNASTLSAGKGGNVTVNASQGVQVIGTSLDSQWISGLAVTSFGIGDAGNLTIITPELLIQDGAAVIANTFGAGKGGDLTVDASEAVQVIGTSLDGQLFSSLAATSFGTGDAGNLTIITPELLISGGAKVSSSTFGSGKGGNLLVQEVDVVQVIGESADGQFGSTLSAETNANSTGDAGDLTISSSRLLISDGAQVSASTFGEGNGGNLTVTDAEEVQVIGTSADGRFISNLSADTDGIGNAGNLTITTSRLLIAGGAQISVSTFGEGIGGNLTVDASELVQVIGTSTDGQISSKLSAQANPNSTGDAGNLTIITPQLLISGGAQVSTSTFGEGDAGNLTVVDSEIVQVIGRSANGEFGSNLSAQANLNSTGDAGNLSITTSRLLISDGAQVSTRTFGEGNAGNLTVNASEDVQVIGESADGKIGSFLSAQTDGTGNAGDLSITTSRLLIKDGAAVIAATFGEGEGGNLRVDASESVQVIGTSLDGRFPSGLFVSATTTDGIAGSLFVETGEMSVRDEAEVNVSSPFGQAGNLTITADFLLLNQGSILAVTGKSTSEGGANITLNGLDFVRMDNESLISASALEVANGGNITIDSTFIVAPPPTGQLGSDIIANADRGNGGRINITTQGIFGIEFRDELTPDNDITASSNVGLDGEFILTQPDVDPSRGLAELPTDVIDGTRQIDRRCTPRGAAQDNSFTVTGRGGLPPNPTDPLTGEAVIADWVTLDSEENTDSVTPEANPTSAAPKPLVEAQSWAYSPNGQVVLVAQAPTVTPQRPWQASPSCDDFQATAH